MTRKWLAIALLIGSLSTTLKLSAQGQAFLPRPVGAARMPEPLSYTPKKPLPPLIPGPLSPAAAPRGPSPDLSLPMGHPSAFQCEEPAFHHEVYFHLGPMFLQRQRLGRTIVATIDILDRNTLDEVAPGNNFFQEPYADTNQLNPNPTYGGTFTFGIIGRRSSVELTGFYLPQHTTRRDYLMVGELNLPIPFVPVGFAGNNGLFTDADLVQMTIQSEMHNLELNARHFNPAVLGCEPIIGLRFLHYNERFGLFVSDDLLSFVNPLTGRSSPLTDATLSIRAQNVILAPQLGIEGELKLLKGLSIGMTAKIAAGVNFAKTRTTLTRGDGLPGLPFHGRHRIQFSQISELNVFVDAYVTERFRFRGGYRALFLTNVLEAVDQLDFNLTNPLGRQDNSGDIFFHGPHIEMQFLF